jgi:multidrug efflux pump subunit AcrA (membrane-fusion protein)
VKKELVVGALLLALAVGIGVWSVSVAGKNETLVQAVSVERKNMVVDVLASCHVELDDYSPIATRVSGKVGRLFVKDGDEVKQGQLLLELDTRDFNVQKVQAEGTLMSASNQLAKAQIGARQQEIAQVYTQVSQAEANYHDAIRKMERVEGLYKIGGASQEQMDDARLRVRVLEQQLQSAQEQLSLTKEGATAEDLGNLVGQVRQAQAGYQRSQDQLDYAVVVSPIEGVVFNKDVQEGKMVTPEMTLMTIANMRNIVIQAEVEEQYLWALEPGTVVRATGNGFHGREYTGKVKVINPVALYSPVKTKTSKYIVKVQIDNPDIFIRPGMTGEIHFQAVTNGNSIVIPREALLKNTTKTQVFVIEGDYIHLTEIKLGLEDNKFLEVVAGLREGQQVVLNPVDGLADNVRIRL